MERRWNGRSTSRGASKLWGLLLLLICLGGCLYLGGCAKAPEQTASQGSPGGETPDTLRLTGLDEAGRYAEDVPMEVDAAMLKRGEEAYVAFCVTCHGESGDGRGPVFQATGVLASDLRTEYVRNQPDGQVFVSISRGIGMMVGFESQLSVEDRWSVVAYVRTLPPGETP